MKKPFRKIKQELSLLILGVVFAVLVLLLYLNYNIIQLSGHDEKDLYIWYGVIFISSIAALAIITYFKLDGLSRSITTDSLVHIAQQLNNESVTNAKIILHRIYFEKKQKNQSLSEKELWEKVGETLVEWSHSFDLKIQENHLCVISFFDFLESLARFQTLSYLTKEQLYSVVGESLNAYCQVTSQYNESSYQNLQQLQKSLFSD